jgi:SAM-dependent methyltransferase
MSREFSHVKFDGLDIGAYFTPPQLPSQHMVDIWRHAVPIATRSPPDNVRFEMADVNAPFRYNNGTFDLVHARSISMAVRYSLLEVSDVSMTSAQVRDYSRVVQQVARVLRPGGLFLACEWGRSAEMTGGRDPAVFAPRTCLFYHRVHEALEHRAIAPVARHLARIVQESRQFERIRPRMYEMPVGNWPSEPHLRAIGERFRTNLVIYAQSMGILMYESGRYHPRYVQEIVTGFIYEMYHVPGIVCKYFTVRARKVHT